MPGWILNLTTAGHGAVRAGAAGLVVGPGEVLLFAPGAAHDYDRAPGAACWHHRWVYFRPRAHWLPWLAWGRGAVGIGRAVLPAPAWPELERILAECESAAAGAVLGQELAMCRCEEALLWLAARRAPLPEDDRAARARAFIEERHHLPLSVAEIAAQVGLSPSRLAHAFRAATGMGVIAYRDAARIQRAGQLLRTTGMPVAAVGRAVGYPDQLYFARVFRRHTGASPSAWRAAAGTTAAQV